jgi:AraC-like DNA-binding protein
LGNYIYKVIDFSSGIVIMDFQILCRHKFQFISFCYVYHPERKNSGRVQLNNDSHMLHISKGSGIINAENKSYLIKAGDVVAIPPFTPFTMNISDKFEMLNLHYKIWIENDEIFDCIRRLPFVFSPPYFKWCQLMLFKIKKIHDEKLPCQYPDALAHEIILKHFFKNSMIKVARDLPDQRIKKVQKHLEYPALMEFDSDKLASLCNLSKSQMNRNFRKFFGISPLKYWEKQRLKKICMTLKISSDTIYEIADKYGFRDQGYFCRWFKRMTKYTPVEYRKKLSIEDELI